ncbi:MAG: hypothetical protein ACI9SP_003121 [Arenicella sp.]
MKKSKYDELKHADIDMDEYLRLADLDDSPREWRATAKEYRAKFEKRLSDEVMGGIIESQWQELNYHSMDREGYYENENSPLDVLAQCMGDRLITYPPPEILELITNQFRYYLFHGGKISLEEAFFGSSSGRGNYAKRVLSENHLYVRFHRLMESERFGQLPQTEVLELISTKENSLSNKGFLNQTNEFYDLNQRGELENDSFLRGYRRWKKRELV